MSSLTRLHGSEQQTGDTVHLNAPPESISLTMGLLFREDVGFRRRYDFWVSIGGDIYRVPITSPTRRLVQVDVTLILLSSLLSNIFGVAFNRVLEYVIVIGTSDLFIDNKWQNRHVLFLGGTFGVVVWVATRELPRAEFVMYSQEFTLFGMVQYECVIYYALPNLLIMLMNPEIRDRYPVNLWSRREY
ncbi:hypothetical protein ARMSODRAFT_975850 [Armillaria solidipes]|uniref:Uncharacterized protein n=1 Tax=Armillaria solidipes TaxID=1076256 RepID=A0A2H3BN96_9AGAR|nr:hypothetical protein ARMSODRAFT_975850 [Armillaria solidipes]